MPISNNAIGRCRLFVALMTAASSLALLLPHSALAQSQGSSPVAPAAQQDVTSVTVAVDTEVTLRSDKSATTVETRRIKILGTAAIASEGQQSIGYIEGLQTLQIAAYTQKADGTKIPVDPDSILTRDAASGLAAVYERDAKVRTVIFRDVAVGDTLVMTSTRIEKSDMFAGQYSKLLVFPLHLPVVDSKTVIVAPKSVALNVGVYGEQLEHKVVSDESTTRHVISYHPRRRTLPEPGATSLLDRDPRIIVSTFESYEQLGRSYWAAVEAKARPTPEIVKLASEITKGIEDRRAQAEAIDHWIKQNIRYVGVYLGTGRVIANDPATVLKNRYGDCKDHATLMTALLAAKGIKSEQVLINLGDVYSLPETVSLSYFNHVMVYLPELGLYNDPTASLAAFSVLPRLSYDKPVLHVSAKGAHLARTPAMRSANHVTTNRTHMAIAADGTVTGETRDTASGANAIEVRGIASKLQGMGLETAAERMLQYLNNPGKGRFEIGSLLDGAAEYSIVGKFTLSARLNVTPGALVSIPRGLDVLAPGRPGEVLFGVRLPKRQVPFACFAGRQVEDIEVAFAEGLPLPAVPKGVKVNDRHFTYASEYRLEDRTLKIRREFESLVDGQVCAPETEAAIAEPMRAVWGDLTTRIGFQKASTQVAAVPPDARKPAQHDALLDNRRRCAGADNVSADLRIGACTAFIQAGQDSPSALAADFANRGFGYRMKGEQARAIEDFDQALRLLPNYAFALNGRGMARHALRDYDLAIADFNEAIKLSPTFSNAFANRGRVFWDKGARDGAMEDFNQATALDPSNGYAFQARGRAYRQLGDFDHALADLDQMVRIQKSNAAAWGERCYTYLISGSSLQSALADCDESLRLKPNYTAALVNRGLVLLRLAEIDRALADFDAAMRLAPRYALALYGRGAAKLKKGDVDGGNADISAANALNANVAKDFTRYGLTVTTLANPGKPVL